MNKRIYRASELGTSDVGWIVDMSSPDAANPDARFTFSTRKQAWTFLNLVDSGMSTDEAVYSVKERGRLAAALGKLGGSATSFAKTAAARENGKLGGRPRKE